MIYCEKFLLLDIPFITDEKPNTRYSVYDNSMMKNINHQKEFVYEGI